MRLLVNRITVPSAAFKCFQAQQSLAAVFELGSLGSTRAHPLARALHEHAHCCAAAERWCGAGWARGFEESSLNKDFKAYICARVVHGCHKF